jgi:hypothetical protein
MKSCECNENENNCTSSSPDIMAVNTDKVDEITVILYPSPIANKAILELNNSNYKTIQLVDSRGVLTRTWNTNDRRINIAKNDLSSGNYFLTIIEGNSTTTIPIIFQ